MCQSILDHLPKNLSIRENLSSSQLIEEALRQNPTCELSAHGPLVIKTGQFTGRAVDDKYVVLEPYSEKVIDWDNNIKKMSPDTFLQLKKAILETFEREEKPLYIADQSVGALADYNMGITLVTPSASHALFAQLIFRRPEDKNPLGQFVIYHHPDFLADTTLFSTRSGTVISINFHTKEVIIVGTAYAGEIKKSVFSILNTVLPEKGILPMHSGCSQNAKKDTFVFFGLSGTGKTTLSTDEGVDVIGDDEHGLSPEGVFNFEGGCYAKTNGLSFEREPDIHMASNRFGSLLENVRLDPVTRVPLFNDTTLTENGRATYPLSALAHVVPSSAGKIPQNIFFLSADALGVLPAVSLLSADQAMFYFLTGYTAKLAGTEIGLKGVKTTFSHCFGAPFMMRPAKDYGELLKHYMSTHDIKVWLVNTGWFGGVYGEEGKRYPLAFTRSCIRAIQNNEIDKDHFNLNDIFSLKIPKSLPSVDENFLDPRALWKDKRSYDKVALDLRQKFEENFKKFSV